MPERNRNAALNLAREYYDDSNLKKKERAAYKTCWFSRHYKKPQCKYNVV